MTEPRLGQLGLIERLKYRLACWYLESDHIARLSQYVYEKDQHYNGPRCPDCQYAPDPGPDGECDECAQRWLQKKAEEAIYGTGYEDGYTAAEHSREAEESW